MNKKELCYILIVVLLGVSLLLGFAVEVFGIDLGPAAWVAGWVSSPVALAVGFAFAMLFGKAFPDFNHAFGQFYGIFGSFHKSARTVLDVENDDVCARRDFFGDYGRRD